jgi:hypothetical protein
MVLTTRVADSPNPLLRTRFFQGVLIQCQSYHGDYVCSFGGVAMSGSDGMSSSTQVPAARHMWVPMVMSCRVRH